jgi:hypothetical protein
MSREAREKLVARMYKQQLKSTGKLPSGREKRVIERKAAQAAQRAERKKSK